MRRILELILDLVSQHQTTIEQLSARVSSLEETHSKQRLTFNEYTKKRCKTINGWKNTATKKCGFDLRTKVRKLPKSGCVPLRVSTSSCIFRRSSKAVRSKRKIFKALKRAKVKKLKSKVAGSTPPLKKKELESVKNPLLSKKLLELQTVGDGAPSDKQSNALPDQSTLHSVDEVLQKYEEDVVKGNVTSICCFLAREAIFGDEVMKQCTPEGLKSYPALPKEPFNRLKRVVFQTFPDSWSKPSDFEEAWQSCLTSLRRTCSTLRSLDTCARDPCALAPQESSSVLKTVRVKNSLSSSEIDKSKLMDIETFLAEHSKHIKDGKYTLKKLTCEFAVHVVFGKEILLKCSPCGQSPSCPGLPVAELNLLKQLVFEHCPPSYKSSVKKFEGWWSQTCMAGLCQLCSTLRYQRNKTES